MKFEDMNIEKSVLGSLSDIGFEEPTKIQYETIPVIKQGYDVIGQSETGSGKTAAFGIPLVEKVTKGSRTQALVLAPTRELSIQIANELVKFSRFKGLSVQTVYGGVPIEPQIHGLRKAEIIVGTPGRILDHMKRGTFDATNLKMFVLDEADKMIDMGFVDDIELIEENIPKSRQTLLFSATMPEALISIRDRFTRNAKKIKTETQVREDILKQFYYNVDFKSKFSLLVHLMKQEDPKLTIIFCNSRRDADAVSRNLNYHGIDATVLHGGLTQSRREKVIEDFHKGQTKVLVATDVAGRGLDIKNVSHVFNYSIPKSAEDYVNRIGRTARAGESGKAISLLDRNDYEFFRKIITSYSFDIEKIDTPDFASLPFRRYESNDRPFRNRRYESRGNNRGRFNDSAIPYSVVDRRGFGNRRFARRYR